MFAPGKGSGPRGVGAWSQGVSSFWGGIKCSAPREMGALVARYPRTATAAGGTHPTGMHSSFVYGFRE